MDLKSLEIDEIFKGWIDLWEFWGPSEHLFRSVNIIEIAYVVAEFVQEQAGDPYAAYDDTNAQERLLRKIIKDKLIRQYRRPDDDQTHADAYVLAARLMRYCQDNPRSKS